MTGIVDVGGGMRDVYSAGIYDELLSDSVKPEYCLGVSAGSANLITYVSGQSGRNLNFYEKYAFRREYMSLNNLLRTGSYLNLDYIYSTLSNSDGEDPLDFDAFARADCRYTAVATRASDGKAHYFTNDDIKKDDYSVLKASCCIPAVCRPRKIGEEYYFDGGVADPVPYKKAFDDGCDRVVAVLTRPVDFVKSRQRHMAALRGMLKKYPYVYAALDMMNENYNKAVAALKGLEKEGRALIVAPLDCCGVDTLTRDRAAFRRLYDAGRKDAEKIERFLEK